MRGCFVCISQPDAGPAAALCLWGRHWHWNRSPEVLCCRKTQLPSASGGVTQVRHLHPCNTPQPRRQLQAQLCLSDRFGLGPKICWEVPRGYKARLLEQCISVRLLVHFCVFLLIL